MDKLKKQGKINNLKNKLPAEFSLYSGLIIVLVILGVVLSLTTTTFLTTRNITNVLRQVAILGVLSVGMSTVMITAEIDLSVGSGVGFLGGILAMLLNSGIPLLPAMVILMLMGAAIGSISGYFVAQFQMPSFIVTLAMLNILRGGLYLMGDGKPITNLPEYFVDISTNTFVGLPVPVWIMIATFIVGWIILAKTSLGRKFFAVGGNIQAASYSGINTKAVKILAFMVSGACVAIAAMLQTTRLGSAQPSAGAGMELEAITATALGGIGMGGGYGSLVGVFVGAILLGVISNGMVLLDINSYLQLIVKGVIILGAVLYNMRKAEN